MTRFIGTGKDPEGRYPKGHEFHVPERDAEFIRESGYGRDAKPEEHPATSRYDVAQAIVRGDVGAADPLVGGPDDHDPEGVLAERARVAESVAPHAQEIVATGDPNAKAPEPETAETVSTASGDSDVKGTGAAAEKSSSSRSGRS